MRKRVTQSEQKRYNSDRSEKALGVTSEGDRGQTQLTHNAMASSGSCSWLHVVHSHFQLCSHFQVWDV